MKKIYGVGAVLMTISMVKSMNQEQLRVSSVASSPSTNVPEIEDSFAELTVSEDASDKCPSPAHHVMFMESVDDTDSDDEQDTEEPQETSSTTIFGFDRIRKITQDLEDAREVDFDLTGRVKYNLSGRDPQHPSIITNYDLNSLACTEQLVRETPNYKMTSKDKTQMTRQICNQFVTELNHLLHASSNLAKSSEMVEPTEVVAYAHAETKRYLLENLPYYTQLMKIVLGYNAPEASYTLLHVLDMKNDMYQAIFEHNQISEKDQKHFDAFKQGMLALKEDARKVDFAKKFASQSAVINSSSTTQN